MAHILGELQSTTQILLEALREGDFSKAQEALSVMLMQGRDAYGPEHPAMNQFFPVWDAIKGHIDRADADRAIGQTEIWERQLAEVIEIVRDAQERSVCRLTRFVCHV